MSTCFVGAGLPAWIWPPASVRSAVSLDTEGGDEIFMQFEPDAVEGIKVCGDEPSRLGSRIFHCPLKALCVSAEPR
jgi:hypothetical protein